MAAAALLRQRGGRVVVTSPTQEATLQLFEAAARCLEGTPGVERVGPFHLTFLHRGSLEFVSPAELLGGGGGPALRGAALLLVDEAAGFPVDAAVDILWRARRVVMSTTLDGYEGSGQGFLVRVLPRLRQTRAQLRHVQLHEPLRWRRGCPLEALANAALLLEARPVDAEAVADTVPENVVFEELDRGQLCQPDGLELNSVFGLLRDGHYKTRPSDVSFFLDSPDITMFVLRRSGHIVGLTVVSVEEPVDDPQAAEELFLRQRKMAQNLLAQTLSAEAGLRRAAGLRYARVLRLCVHAALQRRGLGARLLQETLGRAGATAGVDALGACFGATPWLLKLWRGTGARLAWLAHGRDPSSGRHSAAVLVPLSAAAEGLAQRLQERLALRLPEFLCGPLATLDASTLAEVLAALPPPRGCPPEGGAPSEEDADEVWSFGHGARSASVCRDALVRAMLCALRPPRLPLDTRSEQVLMDFLQNRSAPRDETLARQVARKLPWAAAPRGAGA
ncbi:unnamed protein product, partial [Prorocentrum cordatum]